VNALATYFEIIFHIADKMTDTHLDIVHLVLMPKVVAAMEAIHTSHHLPTVPEVVDSLKPYLKKMGGHDRRNVLKAVKDFQ